jgi:putative FmdB family regulatory protein
MPFYPYRCLDCHKRFEVFLTYSEYGVKPVTCSHCGSANIQRRIHKVRIAKSEESRMESLSDVDDLDGLEDDPRALGKMMRKLSHEMGEDAGPEFDEVIDRLEAGQSPEEIESSLPDLGGDEAGLPGGLPAGDDDF